MHKNEPRPLGQDSINKINDQLTENFKVEDFPPCMDVNENWTDLIYDGEQTLIFQNVTMGEIKKQLKDDEIQGIVKHIQQAQNKDSKALNPQNPTLDLEMVVEDENGKTIFKLRYALISKSVNKCSNNGFCIRKNMLRVLTDEEVNSLSKEKISIPSNNGEVLSSTHNLEVVNFLKNNIFTEKTPKPTIIISGETGSGKTELQKWFIGLLNDSFGIVSIQDTNDVALRELYKKKNITELYQTQYFGMTDGIKSSLRYNPDYIIVSEIRGGEVEPFLEALSTGHPGITTIHARNAVQTIDRIESLYNNYCKTNTITKDDIKQIIDFVIHIESKKVLEDGCFITKRTISSIIHIEKGDTRDETQIKKIY